MRKLCGFLEESPSLAYRPTFGMEFPDILVSIVPVAGVPGKGAET